MSAEPLLSMKHPVAQYWLNYCRNLYDREQGSDWFVGYQDWFHQKAEIEQCTIEPVLGKLYLKFRTDRDLTLFILKYS